MNFFQKLGLALGLGLGVGLAIQVVKMATFDGPDGVQGWESDEKRIFGESFGPKVWKSGLFQKLVLALGLRLGLGLAIQVVKMATFDRPEGVQCWESDEKRIFGQSFGPKVWKSGRFSKARVRLGLGLGLRLAIQVVKMATFDRPDGIQGWESDEKEFFDNLLGPK